MLNFQNMGGTITQADLRNLMNENKELRVVDLKSYKNQGGDLSAEFLLEYQAKTKNLEADDLRHFQDAGVELTPTDLLNLQREGVDLEIDDVAYFQEKNKTLTKEDVHRLNEGGMGLTELDIIGLNEYFDMGFDESDAPRFANNGVELRRPINEEQLGNVDEVSKRPELMRADSEGQLRNNKVMSTYGGPMVTMDDRNVPKLPEFKNDADKLVKSDLPNEWDIHLNPDLAKDVPLGPDEPKDATQEDIDKWIGSMLIR
jgi:hypothetical protein